MDEATAELVLQLQLEDIEQLTRTSKGKRREGDIDDFQLALSLYTAEIQSNATCITDHQMSLSMRNAVRQDAKLIAKWTAQEAQATHDHGLALEIQNGGGATASRAAGRDGGDRPIPNKRNDDTEKELLDKLAALYMFGPADGYDDSHDDDDDNIAQPESSSWAASRPRTKQSQQKPNNKQCVACMENFPSHAVAHAPCSHNYCRTCLTELFTRSLTDQSLFPPRCCGQAIPVGQNRHVLTRQLVGQFEAKKVELETKNPTYCHRPNCSTFIPPQFIRDDIGTCPRCTTRTCAICKGAPHTGDCPDDPATQQLMQVAAENGWQRCNSCHRLVELRSGCYHMSKSLSGPRAAHVILLFDLAPASTYT